MAIKEIFNFLIFQPLLNALILIADVMPAKDFGLAIILLTVIVKLIVLPLTHKSLKAQAKIRALEGDIKKIKEKHKKQEDQARAVMELYRAHGVNPFSGCLFAFIQIPVIFGLYYVFFNGLRDGVINPVFVYSFVEVPASLNLNFLGFIDLTQKWNIFLAVFAGLTQYYQMSLSFPPTANKSSVDDKQKKENHPSSTSPTPDFRQIFTSQMRYMLPVLVAVMSLSFPAAIGLYWVTSNTFSIIHELLVKRKAKGVLEGKTP